MAIFKEDITNKTPLTLTSSELFLDYNNDENSDLFNNTKDTIINSSLRLRSTEDRFALNDHYDSNKFFKRVMLPKHFATMLLDTGTDSVMEYSISSNKSSFRKFNVEDTNIFEDFNMEKLHEEINNILSKEYECSENIVVNMVHILLFDLVKINKILRLVIADSSKVDNELIDSYRKILELIIGSGSHKEIIFQMINKSVGFRSKGSNFDLDNTSLKHIEINDMLNELSKLNYFPMMLINSINALRSERNEQLKYINLFKLLLNTIGCELSKVFCSILSIINKQYIEFTKLVDFIEILLKISIESYNCEMLIGIEDVLVNWYNTSTETEQRQFNNWINLKQEETIKEFITEIERSDTLSNSDVLAEDEEDDEEEDDSDLRFNKYDIMKEFLNCLTLRCHKPIPQLVNHCDLTILEPDLDIHVAFMPPPRIETQEESKYKKWLKDKFKCVYKRCNEVDLIQYYSKRVNQFEQHCIMSELNLNINSIDEIRPTEFEKKYKKMIYNDNKGNRKRDVIKLLFK